MVRFSMGTFSGVLWGGALMAGSVLAPGSVAQISLPTFDAAPLVRSTRRALGPVMPEPGPQAVTVVMRRDGGRVFAGPDFAAHGLSWVLAKSGKVSVDVPAFRGSDRKWNSMMKCVRDQFSGFQVQIVDEAPKWGDHMVAYVGGTPHLLGAGQTVRGLAPHTGRVIPNASVFVFEPRGSNPRDLCEVAAHEIGHAIGLDHSLLCRDLMSYGGCGKKSFQDEVAPCGEHVGRVCEGGAPTQNAVEILERKVGRRVSATS